MKVALVHDWLNQRGGAESVLEAMTALYPGAPIYTSIYDRESMPEAYTRWDVRVTWMDELADIYTNHQRYLPLYPLAFSQIDLREYELVLSNRSGFCHAVRTSPNGVHICYCLTPPRFLWQYAEYAQREALNPLLAGLLTPLIVALRAWDRLAARRVDHFVAISTEVQRRIKRIYKRESEIIYPPVDTHRYVPSATVEDYCLVVSRLVPYKRIDLAVQACTRLELPLIVAGTGREEARLKEMAGPSVQFLGRVPDRDLPDLMARCRVFLFPGTEDFGIAPVEAQAAGRPVLAFRGGGALDSIVEGQTGTFFAEQTPDALCEALDGLSGLHFDPATIRANAERFDVSHFVNRLSNFVDRCLHGRESDSGR